MDNHNDKGISTGRRVALVVGVNRVPHIEMATLHSAESDAQAVAEVLSRYLLNN
jgi:hypothetical protein